MIKQVIKTIDDLLEEYQNFIVVDDSGDNKSGLDFFAFDIDKVQDYSYFYYDRLNYNIKAIRYDDEFFDNEESFVFSLINMKVI